MKNFLRRLFGGGKRPPMPESATFPGEFGPNVDRLPDPEPLIRPRPDDPLDQGPQPR